MLEAALELMTVEQMDDTVLLVVLVLLHQGMTQPKPSNGSTMQACMTALGVPVAFLAMAKDQLFMRPFHLFFIYYSGHGNDAEYDGKILAAISNKAGETNPAFILDKQSYFKRHEMKLVNDKLDTVDLAKWFAIKGNETTFLHHGCRHGRRKDIGAEDGSGANQDCVKGRDNKNEAAQTILRA